MKSRFPREESAGYMTNWAARLFARAIDGKLKALGLSSGQLPVLFALAEGGTLSQRQLVDFAEIEQPTMAATLTRMERDGLVVRQKNEKDGRSALFTLTATALGKISGVRDAIDAVNGAACAAMTDQQRTDYLSLLALAVAGLNSALTAPERR